MPCYDKRYVFPDPEPGSEKVMTRAQTKLRDQLYAAQVKPYKDIIASRFGNYLAEYFDPYGEAKWSEMDVKYLHPVIKPVLYETAKFELTSMAASDLLHEMLSLRNLTRTDVVGIMRRVWKILINDPSQFPLYPASDIETFSMNYVRPSLEGYDQNGLWKRLQNIDHILKKAGFPRTILPKLQKAYDAYFNNAKASGKSQPQKAFSKVQYSTVEVSASKSKDKKLAAEQ